MALDLSFKGKANVMSRNLDYMGRRASSRRYNYLTMHCWTVCFVLEVQHALSIERDRTIMANVIREVME